VWVRVGMSLGQQNGGRCTDLSFDGIYRMHAAPCASLMRGEGRRSHLRSRESRLLRMTCWLCWKDGEMADSDDAKRVIYTEDGGGRGLYKRLTVKAWELGSVGGVSFAGDTRKLSGASWVMTGGSAPKSLHTRLRSHSQSKHSFGSYCGPSRRPLWLGIRPRTRRQSPTGSPGPCARHSLLPYPPDERLRLPKAGHLGCIKLPILKSGAVVSSDLTSFDPIFSRSNLPSRECAARSGTSTLSMVTKAPGVWSPYLPKAASPILLTVSSRSTFSPARERFAATDV